MLSLVFFRMVNWNDLDTESSECSCPRTAEEVPMGEDNNSDSMLRLSMPLLPSSLQSYGSLLSLFYLVRCHGPKDIKHGAKDPSKTGKTII